MKKKEGETDGAVQRSQLPIPKSRDGIETRAGVVGVYKTKKKAEKVLDEIAEQIGCCKADKSFTRVEGSADSV